MEKLRCWIKNKFNTYKCFCFSLVFSYPFDNFQIKFKICLFKTRFASIKKIKLKFVILDVNQLIDFKI